MKIPNEDFTHAILTIFEMMLVVVLGVMDMEVVADEKDDKKVVE